MSCLCLCRWYVFMDCSVLAASLLSPCGFLAELLWLLGRSLADPFPSNFFPVFPYARNIGKTCSFSLRIRPVHSFQFLQGLFVWAPHNIPQRTHKNPQLFETEAHSCNMCKSELVIFEAAYASQLECRVPMVRTAGSHFGTAGKFEGSRAKVMVRPCVFPCACVCQFRILCDCQHFPFDDTVIWFVFWLKSAGLTKGSFVFVFQSSPSNIVAKQSAGAMADVEQTRLPEDVEPSGGGIGATESIISGLQAQVQALEAQLRSQGNFDIDDPYKLKPMTSRNKTSTITTLPNLRLGMHVSGISCTIESYANK